MANSIDVGKVKGIDGKSPYQVAVEEGYTGTESEFYAALVSLKNAPFLPSNGGQMSGPLDMGGYRIDNIQRLGVPIGGNPLTVTASGLSITDGSDEKFGVSSGRVDVHGSIVQNVGDPSNSSDAVNKNYAEENFAAKSHKHSATSDITSGILPVKYGGTGWSSLSPFELLYANGTESINQIALPKDNISFLRGFTSQAPAWYGASQVRSLLEVPKFVTGSYVGKGEYGSENPTEITFSSAPSIVFITSADSTPSKNSCTVIIPVSGKTVTNLAASGLSTSSPGVEPLKATLSGNTLSFYSERDAVRQLNETGVTYYYRALIF
jgi:hypothetical protein